MPDSRWLKISPFVRFPAIQSEEKQRDFGSDAARIRKSFGIFTTDEASILEVVQGNTPADMAQIGKEYRARYGSDLVQDLRKNLRSTLDPQISENMFKVGEAIYGHQPALLAAFLDGYRPMKNGFREDPLRGLDKNVAESLVEQILDKQLKADPTLAGKIVRAHEEFFGTSAGGTSRYAAAKELNKLLLP
jgi:hypothetical protein